MNPQIAPNKVRSRGVRFCSVFEHFQRLEFFLLPNHVRTAFRHRSKSLDAALGVR